jgi:hypothetical protein
MPFVIMMMIMMMMVIGKKGMVGLMQDSFAICDGM